MDYADKLNEIEEVANEVLNEWEIDFINSLLYTVTPLTDKQKAKIDEIYKKVCKSPY